LPVEDLVMAERMCLHTPCGCRPDPGEEFCDAICETASRSGAAEARCACDHPECRPDNARKYDPSEQESPLRPEDVSNGPEIAKS
jgi:hypothetical protein